MLLRFLWYCYQLTRNQWLKPSKLTELQRKRLMAILRHAYENVPLYRLKFDFADVKPDDIKSIQDLSKLPFITKQEIKSGIPDKSIAKGYYINGCVSMPTSGTSGGPMPVYYDKRFWDYICAAYHRHRRALGLNPWDKTLSIQYWGRMPDRQSEVRTNSRSKRRSHWRISLGPVYLLFRQFMKRAYLTYTADEIISEIIDYQPKIISGSPSYLRLIAEMITDRGITNVHPKLLFSGGEVLDEPTRKFLEFSFGCEVFDGYWANEVGSIAWECGRKEGHHIDADLLIMEIVRDGKVVGPCERGEIVVTGLLNYAMPLIRYRVGDIGILDDELCSCGRGLPLLKSIEGRAVDCFTLPNGRIITPKVIMTVVQGTLGVSRYQVVQENEKKITIELMRKESDPDVPVNELIARCHEVLGNDVEIEVFVSDRKDLKAKFRPVISKLTVSGETRWTKPREYQILAF